MYQAQIYVNNLIINFDLVKIKNELGVRDIIP